MLSQADSNHHNFSFATFEPPQFSPLRRKNNEGFLYKEKALIMLSQADSNHHNFSFTT